MPGNLADSHFVKPSRDYQGAPRRDTKWVRRLRAALLSCRGQVEGYGYGARPQLCCIHSAAVSLSAGHVG